MEKDQIQLEKGSEVTNLKPWVNEGLLRVIRDMALEPLLGNPRRSLDCLESALAYLQIISLDDLCDQEKKRGEFWASDSF